MKSLFKKAAAKLHPTPQNLGQEVLEELCKDNPSLEKIRALVNKGASLHEKGEHGYNALPLAVHYKHEAIARLLIEKGSPLNEGAGYNNASALIHALRGGLPALADLLIDKGADINASAGSITPLSLALDRRYVAIAEKMIDLGCDLVGTNEDGDPLLVQATESGSLSIMQKLLFKNIPVHETDKNGWTALHIACWFGKTDMVKALLAHGAGDDVNDLDHGSATRVVALAIYHHYGDTRGATPLIYAAFGGYAEIVRQLINKGADVNKKSRDGYTALMWAAHNGHLETVRLLLDNGADDTLRHEGKTALDYATERFHDDVIKCLANKELDRQARSASILQQDVRPVKKFKIKQRKPDNNA